MSTDLSLIARRRSHVLVYNPGDVDPEGWRDLERRLSVFEKDVRQATWVSFCAKLLDVDPRGRRVMRLPREVEPDLLRAAFPRHTVGDLPAPWSARGVSVRFRTREYPFRSSDQSRIVEYLAAEDGHGTKLVVAGTASGKSYCAIRAWCGFGDVLLGTFAQATHLENFRAELMKFTDLEADDILVVDDGRQTIRRALAKPEEAARYKAVLVLHRTVWNCMSDSINGGAVSGTNEFSRFVQQIGVGTHVSDECHLKLASVMTLAMMSNFSRTFYLTATAARTQWSEDRVLKQQLPLGRALVVRGEKRLVSRQIRFDSRPTDADQIKCVNRRDFFDINWYFDYLARKDKWDTWAELVTGLVGRAFDEGASGVGIVVSGRLEFLDRVVSLAREAFPGRTVGNFSSRVKAGEARAMELDRDIVVTTEKSFGGSVNPPRMSHLLLMAPLSSPVWVEQVAGRLRGLDGRPCVLLDAWDGGFERLVRQSKARFTVLKKLSTEITREDYAA